MRFQTKPELAVQMIKRIRLAQIPISWVVADTVYGGNLDLRPWLEAHGYPYVMAVACNEPGGFQAPTGRRREEAGMPRSVRPSRWGLAAAVDERRYQRPQARTPWAIVPMLHQWEDDGRHWMLIRRSLADPSEKAVLTVNINGTVWLFIRADFCLLKLGEMLMVSLVCTIVFDTA